VTSAIELAASLLGLAIGLLAQWLRLPFDPR
jgi:hypothetical protein